MGNTEDYLDSLLNSINNSNMSETSQKEESPVRDSDELFRRFVREQELKREQRKKKEEERQRESSFLQEFEEELEDENTDAFLQEFELELEAEKGQDLDQGIAKETNFFENLEGIVSDASSQKQENEKQTKQNSLSGDTQEKPSDEIKQEPAEYTEEPLMDSLMDESAGEPDLSGGAPEPDYATEELMEEGDNGDEDLLNLLKGMSDDEDISEIGDLLKADEESIELEESSLEIPLEADLGMELGGSMNEEKTPSKSGKKNKKGKEKKGFFAKLSVALFGNDEEETNTEQVTVPEMQDLENISEENLQILKELEAAEKENSKDSGQSKKEKRKKRKEKKEKKPKEKKAKREKKPKKEKKPKEKVVDNTPPLPRKPVILIFLLAFSVLFLVLLTINGIGRYSYLDAAKQAIDNGEYVEAYQELSGLELKESEQKIFEKAEAMAMVQEQYDSYLTLMGADKYSLALDALVRGIGRYDKNLEIAQKYGLEKEMTDIKDQLAEALENQFGMTEEDARELYKIKNREEYSIRIERIIDDMNLGQVEE